MERTEIVFNRMFSGSYLQDNIGHEFINMYKDDNNDNYVYIQPYGTYSSEHYDKIKYVLFVRNIDGRHALEVLGRAEIEKDIYNPSLNSDDQKAMQSQYMGVRYGGATILDIFQPNHIVEAQTVYISMKASNVMIPNRQVYIVFGEDNYSQLRSLVGSEAEVLTLAETKQAKSSLKQYITTDLPEYNKVLSLVENQSIWTKPTEPIGQVDDEVEEEKNFFEICGISDYELAFSNVLGHYMSKYPFLVTRFAKQVLNIDVNEFHDVERETDNIDLLLENDEEIVVIENKVTSKINGIQISENKLVGTQLGKYHRKCVERLARESQAKGSPVNKKIACYVLTPDYNQINLLEYDTPDFKCSEYYRVIFYSQVYEFLLNNRLDDDPFFEQLLKGISKHAQKYYNDLYADMKHKFVKRLRALRNNPVQHTVAPVSVKPVRPVVPVQPKPAAPVQARPVVAKKTEPVSPVVVKPAVVRPATPVVALDDKIVLNSNMTVGDLASAFKAKYGSVLRVYSGRTNQDSSVLLSSVSSKSLDITVECGGNMRVGDFVSLMETVCGLKVKVYTVDEWVKVLDELTLAESGRVKRNATRADMYAMIGATPKSANSSSHTDDSLSFMNDLAICGSYIIRKAESGNLFVGTEASNVKALLRQVSDSVSFAYDASWTTRQFGSKFIRQFGDGKVACVGNDLFVKEQSGSIRAFSACSDLNSALNDIAQQSGFSVDSSLNADELGVALINFLKTKK